MTNIKFMYNGIKIDGKLHKASYSKGNYYNLPDSVVTIHGKRYRNLPDIGLDVENKTDLQSDYFENDAIRVFPDHPRYKEVLMAYEQQEAKAKKTYEKRMAKYYGAKK